MYIKLEGLGLGSLLRSLFAGAMSRLVHAYNVCAVLCLLYVNPLEKSPPPLHATDVHVRKSQIQGLFKDIQGHVSANSRSKY